MRRERELAVISGWHINCPLSDVLRRFAAILIITVFASGLAPYVALGSAHTMACCPDEQPRCADDVVLRCCTMGSTAPAIPVSPTISSPAGQRDEVGVIVASTAPHVDSSVAASRAFTARQRCLVHDSPHLRLHVLLI